MPGYIYNGVSASILDSDFKTRVPREFQIRILRSLLRAVAVLPTAKSQVSSKTYMSTLIDLGFHPLVRIDCKRLLIDSRLVVTYVSILNIQSKGSCTVLGIEDFTTKS